MMIFGKIHGEREIFFAFTVDFCLKIAILVLYSAAKGVFYE